MNLRRREFLRSISAGSGALALPALLKPDGAQYANELKATGNLRAPPLSGIEHVVVVMMENRSFDHFLGWLPGADGRQNATYLDKNNVGHPTWDLAPDYEGCGYHDPDHSYGGSRVAYNGGNMDGFLRAGNNDLFSIGYYTERDLPFFSALARNFLVCDRSFASILGPTFANRMFLWAAQTDRLDDSITLSKLPTIFDALSNAGISHRYYFNNVPYTALWGFKYFWSTSLFGDFLSDAAAGKLPAVSFLDPNFTVLDDGTGNDDHPHADIRNGDAFLSQIYRAVSRGPAWQKTVLIVTFDEWGGFFEHIAPPRVTPANGIDTDQVNGQVLLGFRIPTVIVSPFTVNTSGTPQISSTVFDHTSVLKLIEWRWGLRALTPRDASPQIGNPASAMSFGSPVAAAPDLPQPKTVTATPCFQGGIFSANAPLPGASATGGSTLTEWGALASQPHVQQWLEHPRFRNQIQAR